MSDDGNDDVFKARFEVPKIDYSTRVASSNVFLGIQPAYYKNFNEYLPCRSDTFSVGNHRRLREHNPLHLDCGDEFLAEPIRTDRWQDRTSNTHFR
jgi:hypothetical protein